VHTPTVPPLDPLGWAFITNSTLFLFIASQKFPCVSRRWLALKTSFFLIDQIIVALFLFFILDSGLRGHCGGERGGGNEKLFVGQLAERGGAGGMDSFFSRETLGPSVPYLGTYAKSDCVLQCPSGVA
jgi:hypothetical protein